MSGVMPNTSVFLLLHCIPWKTRQIKLLENFFYAVYFAIKMFKIQQNIYAYDELALIQIPLALVVTQIWHMIFSITTM